MSAAIGKLPEVVLFAALAAVFATPSNAQQATDAAKPTPAARTSPAEPSTARAADGAADAAADNSEAAATAALIAKANASAAVAGKSSAKPVDTAAIAKKAKRAGWRAEVKDGNTVYCRDDPQVGSRFSSRRCVNETQLATLMEQAEFDKDQLKQRGCSGSCGGK
jgi:hypothetical protein